MALTKITSSGLTGNLTLGNVTITGSLLDSTGSPYSSGSDGTGFTGSQGVDGYNGSFGYTGSIGFTGSTGVGFTGSTGEPGAIGYTGSAGSSGGGGSSATMAVQEFVATEGQDTFAVSGGYTVDSVLVFVNGIQMNNSDYTASDTVSVVLTEPRKVGDVVRVIFSMVAPSININNIKSYSVAMSVALGF
jgi:hypothetical protein